jgi:hypothetical protein
MKLVLGLASAILMVFPMFTGAAVVVNPGGVTGDPCLVPIYHTEFAFPPEGGEIAQIGNQMYFVRTYNPNCAHYGSGNVAAVSTPVVTHFPSQTAVPVSTVQTVPYVAPNTGCSN